MKIRHLCLGVAALFCSSIGLLAALSVANAATVLAPSSEIFFVSDVDQFSVGYINQLDKLVMVENQLVTAEKSAVPRSGLAGASNGHTKIKTNTPFGVKHALWQKSMRTWRYRKGDPGWL